MTDIHNSHKKDGRIYVAIDLKSFYASVECHERMLDPLETNLVVADLSRTEKTICLAVSPSLKKYGISGRARLFEVIQTINRENNKRLKESHYFNGESCLESKLQKNKHLKNIEKGTWVNFWWESPNNCGDCVNSEECNKNVLYAHCNIKDKSFRLNYDCPLFKQE